MRTLLFCTFIALSAITISAQSLDETLESIENIIAANSTVKLTPQMSQVVKTKEFKTCEVSWYQMNTMFPNDEGSEIFVPLESIDPANVKTSKVAAYSNVWQVMLPTFNKQKTIRVRDMDREETKEAAAQMILLNSETTATKLSDLFKRASEICKNQP